MAGRGQDPIKKIKLKSGEIRYRFIIDIGKKPDGRRDQKCYTFDDLKKAKNEYVKVRADLGRGTFIRPEDKTVEEHCAEWLAGRRKLAGTTSVNYEDALKSFRERLGHVPLQKLTKAQVDAFVDWQHAHGRRIHKGAGGPLSARTVNLTLTVAAMAFDDAMAQGLVARNVVRLVDRLTEEPKPTGKWTDKEATAFLRYAATDPLYVAWCLSLYGLRRGEVMGLRWCDVDLKEGTIQVKVTRIMKAGRVVHAQPKSKKGYRTLPLDDELLAELKRLKAQRAKERLAAGAKYRSCPDCDEVHIFCDIEGVPVHPEHYSALFERMCKVAKVPAIRLHDTRHTAGSIMHLRGVKIVVIAAWLGHSDPNFTLKTYVHSDDDELLGARSTLSAAYKRGTA